jgi:hypothetical protein
MKIQPKGKNRPSYEIDSSHVFIFGTTLSFDLCITRMNSFLKAFLHVSTVGSTSLNNQAFISDHILQHIMIYVAKGTLSFLLKYLVTQSTFSHVGTAIPI